MKWSEIYQIFFGLYIIIFKVYPCIKLFLMNRSWFILRPLNVISSNFTWSFSSCDLVNCQSFQNIYILHVPKCPKKKNNKSKNPSQINSNTMLTSANQYLRPEYLPPVSSPVSEIKNISIENTIDTNLIWKNYNNNNNNNLVGRLWADYLKFNLLYQKKISVLL